jgi:hypothetical protein
MKALLWCRLSGLVGLWIDSMFDARHGGARSRHGRVRPAGEHGEGGLSVFLNLRPRCVPLGALFVSVRDLEDVRFVERFA